MVAPRLGELSPPPRGRRLGRPGVDVVPRTKQVRRAEAAVAEGLGLGLRSVEVSRARASARGSAAASACPAPPRRAARSARRARAEAAPVAAVEHHQHQRPDAPVAVDEGMARAATTAQVAGSASPAETHSSTPAAVTRREALVQQVAVQRGHAEQDRRPLRLDGRGDAGRGRPQGRGSRSRRA